MCKHLLRSWCACGRVRVCKRDGLRCIGGRCHALMPRHIGSKANVGSDVIHSSAARRQMDWAAQAHRFRKSLHELLHAEARSGSAIAQCAARNECTQSRDPARSPVMRASTCAHLCKNERRAGRDLPSVAHALCMVTACRVSGRGFQRQARCAVDEPISWCIGQVHAGVGNPRWRLRRASHPERRALVRRAPPAQSRGRSASSLRACDGTVAPRRTLAAAVS